MLGGAHQAASVRLRVSVVAGLILISIAVALYLLPAGPGKALANSTAVGSRDRSPMNERRWIRQTIAHMTLQEKVGQLFEINGFGSSPTDTNPQMIELNRQYYGVDNIAQLIEKYHPGGIIYFSWANNLQKPEQIADLSNGIQSTALRTGASLPMIISTDQEEGTVLRIGTPATVFPGNMPLGATAASNAGAPRNLGLSQQSALIMGQELRAMGVNIDNAPVVDVNVEPLNEADGVRAYGDNVPLVSQLGAAQVRGLQTNQSRKGSGATAKHWPGFGAAKENSDFSKATSPQTLREVMNVNVPPFTAAMKAGIDRIMVTHLLFPNITGSQITSLSPFWINGLLRCKLHYNGPVVTDALDAAAVKDIPPDQVALDALKAGDDELLEIAQPPTDPTPAELEPAYNAVLEAVETHMVSESRLDESLVRILDLKWRLGLVTDPFVRVDNVPNVVGTPGHLAVAQEAADRSITLLRNSDKILPLRENSGKKVLITGFGQTATATIGAQVSSRGLTSDVFPTGSSPNDATIAAAESKAEQDDLVIVTTFNAWSSAQQQKLVNRMLGTEKPVIVAAIGTPYDVAYFPKAKTFITSYGYQPVSMVAMVKVLFDELQPTGRLPVTITEPPPSTKLLYPFSFHLALR